MSSEDSSHSDAPAQVRNTFHPEAFRGRVYGVTGGGYRIGEAITKLLASLGASVVVLEYDRSRVQTVAADLEAMSCDCLCLHGDVSDDPFLEDAFSQIERKWGRLDGWVNNVGSDLPPTRLESQSKEQFVQTWQLNVLSAWRCAQLAVPLLRQSTGGSIVNLGSIVAHRTTLHKTAYASAKAGVEGLTRGLTIELAQQGLRVNTVLPGAIESDASLERRALAGLAENPTDEQRQSAIRDKHDRAHVFQPMSTIGRPEDIANAVAFLLSDLARFITGSSITVDGGFMADNVIHRFRMSQSKG